MRIELIYESAADELKKKLPGLKKTDYSTIDNLMQRISKRYKITGKKLHDLFVSKYGHTPDTWIKKYKEKLGEEDVTEEQLDELKCWSGYHRVKGTKAGFPGSCAKNTNEEQELDEKSVSKAQFRTMAAVAHNPKFAKKVGISQKVGKEFHKADKKQDYKKLPAKAEGVAEGEVLPFPNRQQPTKPNLSPIQKKRRITQRSDSENIVPITSNIPWNKLPKDVLLLANNWFWADMEDTGSEAVLDPKGYGSGTKNNLQFITAQLQQRGWKIDYDDDMNVVLTNKKGQSVLLPRDDAYDFEGWAAGTSDLTESVDKEKDVQRIKDFINWSLKTLNVQKPYPKFILSKNKDKAQKGHHTGVHSGDTIWVYIGNRNLVDIFRTIFHELVHHRQDQLGMIKNGDSYPGSPIEALADIMAGKYIKIYGKEHPEIFQ